MASSAMSDANLEVGAMISVGRRRRKREGRRQFHLPLVYRKAVDRPCYRRKAQIGHVPHSGLKQVTGRPEPFRMGQAMQLT